MKQTNRSDFLDKARKAILEVIDYTITTSSAGKWSAVEEESFFFQPQEEKNQSWNAVWPDNGIKIAKNFEKEAQKVATVLFTFKVMFFKIAPKVPKYLGYFCKKICCQDNRLIL